MVEVVCQCGTQLRLDDQWRGKRGMCPTCGAVLQIPAGANTSPPPAPSPEPVAVREPLHAVSPALIPPGKSVVESGRRNIFIPLGFVLVAICLVLTGIVIVVARQKHTDRQGTAEAPDGNAKQPSTAPLMPKPPVETSAANRPPRDAISPPPAPAIPSQNRSALEATSIEPVRPSPRPPTTSPSTKPNVSGLSGVSRRYDDFECAGIQRELAVRVPPAATILEIDGERLRIANVGELQKSTAPLLFLAQGKHVIRFRAGDGLLTFTREQSLASIDAEMHKYFERDGGLQSAELVARGARAMDLHSAPFLLNLLGGAYAGKNQWDAAERKFRRALRVNATFAPAHLNLAVCLARRGKKEAAGSELRLADVFNVGNVFALLPGIVRLQRELGLSPDFDPVQLSAADYISLEPATEEDQRLEAILRAVARYATRDEERSKIHNNIAVHFAESARPELALEHFRGALAELKSAGPDRFDLARRIFSHMQSVCRNAGFVEADEYEQMQHSVAP